MPEGSKKESGLFLYILLGCCFLVIGTSFYFFYVKKDYDFIVEVACDPTIETCVQRDCSNLEDCPPNKLSDFKRYTVNAADFAVCENEDCAKACESGSIACEPIECEEDPIYGESCSVLNVEEETFDKESEDLKTQIESQTKAENR